jgi:hypothetical protein
MLTAVQGNELRSGREKFIRAAILSLCLISDIFTSAQNDARVALT